MSPRGLVRLGTGRACRHHTQFLPASPSHNVMIRWRQMRQRTDPARRHRTRTLCRRGDPLMLLTDPARCHRTRTLCQLVNPSSLRTGRARRCCTRTLCQLGNPSLKVVLQLGRQVNRRTDQKFRHRPRTLSQL